MDGFMFTMLLSTMALLVVSVWCQRHAVDAKLVDVALGSALWMWLCWVITYVIVIMANDVGFMTLW